MHILSTPMLIKSPDLKAHPLQTMGISPDDKGWMKELKWPVPTMMHSGNQEKEDDRNSLTDESPW